jgi:hypothetical protein
VATPAFVALVDLIGRHESAWQSRVTAVIEAKAAVVTARDALYPLEVSWGDLARRVQTVRDLDASPMASLLDELAAAEAALAVGRDQCAQAAAALAEAQAAMKAGVDWAEL